jgi:hypothetical protein
MGFFDNFWSSAAPAAATGAVAPAAGLNASPTADTSSIWSNPNVLSAGILAGTSMLSNLFGGSSADDLASQQFTESQRQFDADMAYKQAALAQQLAIAQLGQGGGGGGGDGGAGIAARTQRDIAKANLIDKSADKKIAALQMPLEYKTNQINAAQTTGTQSGAFFNNLMAGLQRPALRS